jgi:predicted kinase
MVMDGPWVVVQNPLRNRKAKENTTTAWRLQTAPEALMATWEYVDNDSKVEENEEANFTFMVIASEDNKYD